ncbi:serine hydrolase domain-containing protein [Paenibacillus cremeus]|uniref:Beta-lactamase family protein n=1 Tax=Paenibacillus cremeus TaxID=2163881 RepID=A0A559JK88_9BACL|nr:serine hydrolase domain-containing protein [Paenibacillus cremeus]TVY00307.1 beta-lactamase family protein [Paenibacillus cremeus]
MDKIHHFLQKKRDQKAFSCAVYAYGNSTGILDSGVVGTLSWEGPAADTESLFDLASVTKPIVALAIMKLFEAGELRLDDTVSRFLPDYGTSDKADITLFQLLTHTSGIPGQQPLFHFADTRDKLMRAVRQLPLRFKAGTNVEYTSQGFMILGDIIEAVLQQRLDCTMKELVLEPVGMSQTIFNPSAELRDRIAATEYCSWRNRIVQGEVHDENAVILGGIAGHAGLFGTVSDLSRLAQTMLCKGETHQGKWLHAATVELMSKRHTPPNLLSRCLGWQGKDARHSPAGDLFSDEAYGHTGFTGTSIFMDPAHDRFAILLTNRVHPSRDNDSIASIRAIYHNLVCLATS